MKRTTSILVCAALSLFLIASGCLRGVRSAPDLTHLDINPGTAPSAGAISGETLMLRRIHIQSPFDDRRFTYKTGSGTYKQDYYVRFVASPSDLFTDRMETWLAESRLLRAVVEPGTSVDYRYVLEGEITELFGDYSDPQKPMAVIAADFTLVDDMEGRGKIVFNKGYRYVEPVASSGAESLAASWGTALRKMLLALTGDLQGRFSEIK